MTKTATLRFARMLHLMIIVAENKTTRERLQFMRNGMENLMKFIVEEGNKITAENFDSIDVLFYEWSLALASIARDENADRNDKITALHLSEDLKKNKVRIDTLKNSSPQPQGIPVPNPAV